MISSPHWRLRMGRAGRFGARPVPVEGEMSWVQSMQRRTLERVLSSVRCARCGSSVAVRFNGRTGNPFMGCARFPSCKWASPIPAAAMREANPLHVGG